MCKARERVLLSRGGKTKVEGRSGRIQGEGFGARCGRGAGGAGQHVAQSEWIGELYEAGRQERRVQLTGEVGEWRMNGDKGRYVRTELLGRGVHGSVYKARNSATGEWVALKKTLILNEAEGIPSTTLREISILRTLNNPHVVKLKDVSHYEKIVRGVRVQELTLVFEYIEHDLKKYIRKYTSEGSGLDVTTTRSFCHQILLGLEHCHDNSIMHRDMKPQNILVSNNRTVKIADFGLGRVFTAPEGSYTDEIVTLWYRGPEVLLGTEEYSTAVDMWSVGCILAEMASGNELFRGETELEQLLEIFSLRGTPSPDTWPDLSRYRNWHEFPVWRPRTLDEKFPDLDSQLLDLLERMLNLDPNQRITVQEALRHPFFDEIRAGSENVNSQYVNVIHH